MKNIFKTVFLLLTLSFASSCDVGKGDELNYGNGPYVAQFTSATKTGFFLKDNSEVFTFDVPVEIVGGNGLSLPADTSLSYSVDTAASTAVEGTHFTFVNPGNSSLIPAGSTFAPIKIKVYSANLDSVNPPVLVLKLTSATSGVSNIVTSGNKGSISITLQGTCTSALAGKYSLVTTRLSSGVNYVFTTDTFIQTAPGTYDTTYIANYTCAGQAPAASGNSTQLPAGVRSGYTFKDVCNKMTVETQKLASAFTNEVRQSAAQNAMSLRNPSTGVITIYYSVFFTNNTVERQFRSVYTPI